MPNGHGGVVRFGSAVVLVFVLAVLAFLRFRQGATWTLYPALMGGALLAWRFSWHLHVYPISEYDFAYASEEQIAVQGRRHIVTSIALAVVLVGGLFWAWR